MLVYQVLVHVKAEQLEAFLAAVVENARQSLQEPGIARFDVVQQADDPTRFMLYEAYRSPEDQQKHRETAHYKRWRETTESMMAGPRVPVTYRPIFPPESDWG